MSKLRVVLPYEWGAANDARAIIASAPDDVAEHLAWMYARELNKGAVRTLKDMTEAEIVALEAQYKCPVKRLSVKQAVKVDAAQPVSSGLPLGATDASSPTSVVSP